MQLYTKLNEMPWSENEMAVRTGFIFSSYPRTLGGDPANPEASVQANAGSAKSCAELGENALCFDSSLILDTENSSLKKRIGYLIHHLGMRIPINFFRGSFYTCSRRWCHDIEIEFLFGLKQPVFGRVW